MSPAQPDTARALAIARNWFRAGRRIELRELAAELRVSRATLFRWVGNRDQLLGEILWSLAEPALTGHYRAAPGAGGRRIAGMVGGYVRTVNADRAFCGFLRAEPERALRIVTTRAGVVQRRTIALLRGLLRAEVAAGALIPPLPEADLAYLIVRIAESFIYTDIITGGEPDAAKAEAAVAALLR